MRWDIARMAGAAAAVFAAAACDRLGLGPDQAASSQPETTMEAPPRLNGEAIRAEAGTTYADFVAGAGAQYAPDVIGLSATDRTRLWRAMAAPEAGEVMRGGGAEALVFRGCAETGCPEGVSVVAIDIGTGAAFAAVRDVGGADVLAPNDRIEALLRLNSPSRSWDDPAPPTPSATP